MKLYLTNRFFFAGLGVVCMALLAHSYEWIYMPAVYAGNVLLGLAFAEYLWLRAKGRHIAVKRTIGTQFSMGDQQPIQYKITNATASEILLTVHDELPYQLQHRDHIFAGSLSAHTVAEHVHSIRPTERGEFIFGDIHLFISHPYVQLVQVRKTVAAIEQSAVYPSFIQMKNMELQVFSQTATLAGIRRVREIGENDEFEQIRNYVVGDNVKSINWRATSRRGELMVNQYENSKSQLVYCLVDKGRSMKMPFDKLTLLDYAINTTLVVSNIILKKYDKIGLLTFGNRIGAVLHADSQQGQLQKITKALYDQKTDFAESNFELVYHTVLQRIRRRSILLLFTNFEHPQDMRRQLNYLRSLSKKHLLVVIFFTNAEIEAAAETRARSQEQLYFRTFAQENIMDKERIVSELRRNGIQVILSRPQDLSVNTINKYLEIKAKRMR